MKKRLPLLGIVLVLLVGLGVLLYPSVSNWLSERNQSRAIQRYTEAVQLLDNEEIERQRELATAYNRALGSQALGDPFAASALPGPGDDYYEILNLAGVMGTLEIPRIGVALPIYHGTDESALMKGVGHVRETALPVGGEGTHSVLTGHRAQTEASLFNNLDLLEEGDLFYLQALGDTLAYRVNRILVIEPHDISALLPEAGVDQVTLVTCTPYGINSHRLLVTGLRTEYIPQAMMVGPSSSSPERDGIIMVLGFFAGLWVLLAVGWLLFGKLCHKQAPQASQPAAQKGKHPALLVALGILLVAGVGLMLYPTVGEWWHNRRFAAEIERFAQEVDAPDREALEEYNRLLRGDQADALFNRGLTAEMIGCLQIDRMDLLLPVYWGAGEPSLRRGIGLMENSSYPLGGESTNAVLIGHRNLAAAAMFRHIDRLEPGDVVFFTNHWETLGYRVAETEIVLPEQMERLAVQPGRDLLTLVSCHPRGSEELRYLVYCERVEIGNCTGANTE